MDNTDRLCMSCMTHSLTAETDEICPNCGARVDAVWAAPHHLQPRTILNNKYLVGRVIGEGGFGITYVGWDTALSVKVAIKEYYPNGFVTREATNSTTVFTFSGDKAAFYERGRERFIDEARRLARFFGLPGIVSVKDYFTENGTAYIIMEYLEGATMKTVLENMGGRMPEAHVLEIMKPLIRSLAQMHKEGLIHRDIAPDNIMIQPDGSVKLLDFGAAREVSHDGQSSAVVMKHGYTPEEQYDSDNSRQGAWTDVYALCATIYRAIEGDTPPDAIARLRNDAFCGFTASVSENTNMVVKKGLALFPQDRWQDVGELGNALYLSGVAETTLPHPVIQRTGVGQPLVQQPVADQSAIEEPDEERSAAMPEAEAIESDEYAAQSIEIEERAVQSNSTEAEPVKIESRPAAWLSTILNNVKTDKKKMTIVLGCVLGLMLTVLIIMQAITPIRRYNRAVSIFNDGQYAQAYEAIDSLSPNFRDVSDLLPIYRAYDLLQRGRFEEAHAQFIRIDASMQSQWRRIANYAQGLFSAKRYEEAYEVYKMIKDHGDSNIMLSETQYRLAETLVFSNPAKAKELLTSLGVYEDSIAMIKDIDYIAAVKLLEEGKYSEAWSAFYEIREYKNSVRLMDECRYLMGILFFEEGKYNEAKQRFDSLGSYKNSQVWLQATSYREAIGLLEKGDYSGASSIFTQLGSYEDSKDMLVECDYQHGIALFSAGDYRGAYEMLSGLDRSYKNNRELSTEISSYIFKDVHETGGLSRLEQDYIFHDSNTRYLTEDELWHLTYDKSNTTVLSELQAAINELLARHGRIFTTQVWIDYFSSKTWYSARSNVTDNAIISDLFNQYERSNWNMLVAERNTR